MKGFAISLTTIIVICLLIYCIIGIYAQSENEISVSSGGYGIIKTNMAASYNHGWGAIHDGFAARFSYEFVRNKKFTLTANAR